MCTHTYIYRYVCVRAHTRTHTCTQQLFFLLPPHSPLKIKFLSLFCCLCVCVARACLSLSLDNSLAPTPLLLRARPTQPSGSRPRHDSHGSEKQGFADEDSDGNTEATPMSFLSGVSTSSPTCSLAPRTPEDLDGRSGGDDRREGATVEKSVTKAVVG